MSGHTIDDEDLEEASKDIMNTIDEDGDGDVTKVSIIIYFFLNLTSQCWFQDEFVKNALKRYQIEFENHDYHSPYFSDFIKSIIN